MIVEKPVGDQLWRQKNSLLTAIQVFYNSMCVRQLTHLVSSVSSRLSPVVFLLMVILSISLVACSSSKETTDPAPENGFTLEQAAELAENLEDAEVEERGNTIKVTFGTGLLFDFDSADLRPEARGHLTNLAESLKKNSNTRVFIVGHADSIGTEAYNQRLSERRAGTAARVLAEAGVAPDRITSEGRGEADPVASNSTEEGRQRNRRVEVIISVISAEDTESDGETTIMW
jgi:outer membrane protein OmpA-like peptidoglycan-associated protein